MKENQPSFASSRSLGSVGLPFDDGIATVMVQVLEGGKWGMGIVVRCQERAQIRCMTSYCGTILNSILVGNMLVEECCSTSG